MYKKALFLFLLLLINILSQASFCAETSNKPGDNNSTASDFERQLKINKDAFLEGSVDAATVMIFSKDPELINIAVPGMRIFLSSLVVIGPTIMFITTFQGLSKGRDAMVLSLARQFIFFVPGMYLLSYLMGLNGVWLSMPVSDVAGFLVSGFWIYREYRAQKKSGLWIESPR